MAEREANKDAAGALGTRQNGRAIATILGSRRTSEKSLLPRQESKENVAADTPGAAAQPRPSSSGSSSDNRLSSPQTSRIPRPSQQQPTSRARRPLTFSEAYKLAEEQEAIRGSPSPAPRTWRAKAAEEGKNLQGLFSQKPIDLGRRRREGRRSGESIRDDETISSVESAGSGSRKSEGSDVDFDRKLKQYAEDKARLEGMIRAKNGIFSKSKVGPKVEKTGAELQSKSSNGSLGKDAPRRTWGSLGKPDPNWLNRIMSTPEKARPGAAAAAAKTEEANPDMPVPSVEESGSPLGTSPPKQRPATVPPTRSPNKSFAWQADADFTAGDLQISSSPPVRVGRTNTKLEEIRQLEIDATARFPDSPPREPSLEAEDEGPGDREDGGGIYSRRTGRTNTKIDEIRAREIESLSRKALAKARLDEIRERNSASRSPSPELVRKPSPEAVRETTPSHRTSNDGQRRQSPFDDGEQIPNTPVTVFRHSGRDGRPDANVEPGAAETDGVQASSTGQELDSDSKADSQDVLRRLARVASVSPAPEPQPRPLGNEQDANRYGDEATARGSKPEGATGVRGSDYTRPTVGFAGLKRDPSSDALSSKRSSMVQSDGDPTERIEGEMKLFAPLDNHSERGSVRAPSPEPEDEGTFDETPRPARPDPLSLPTPKITGAYVETPATVKVEDREPQPSQRRTSPPKSLSPLRKRLSLTMQSSSRSHSLPRRSEDAKSGDSGEQLPRSRSLTTLRRSRSLPKSRSPLINSVKPPSVRDDLMAIHGAHNIEDSTLEDFADILNAQEEKAQEVEKILKTDATKRREGGTKPKALSDRERELETYDRISKSLKTGLLDIRTAKKGIEQLEDKVSHADHVPIKQEAKPDTTCLHCGAHPDTKAVATPLGHSSCPYCAAQLATDTVAYIHLPVPRLYHRQPKLRLSLLGWLLVILASWYCIEDYMWTQYGFTSICDGRACNTNPDSPYWGTVIPWKLDEWVLGGRARATWKAHEEDIKDWYMDAYESAMGIDIRTIRERDLLPWDAVQWRRRMRKRGYWREPEWVPPTPEIAAKLARGREILRRLEEADRRKALGLDVEEDEEDGGDDTPGDETMAADEPIFQEDGNDKKHHRWF